MKTRTRLWNIRDEQTIYESMRMYNNLSSQFGKFNDQQTMLYDLTVADEQWDKEIKASIEAEGRPAFSYNIIRTILNVIFGAEESNTEIGKPKPRSGDDNQLTTIVWQTLNYYLYHAKMTMAQKRVFADKTIARLGVYHLGWRYSGTDDENGKLFIDAVDPRELMYEANYNDPLWEKASYIMRRHQMSIEEILTTYALRDQELREAIEIESAVFFDQDRDREKWISKRLKALFSAVYETASGVSGGGGVFKNALSWWDATTGKFDVLELHEKRMERRLIVKDNNRGKIIDITEPYHSEHKLLNQTNFTSDNYEPEIIDRIKERYGIEGDADVDLKNRRFVTAVIPTFNLKVNEQAYPFESNYYVYIPEYCYDYHPDPLKLQSVLDDLKDPQRELNKSRSLIIELIARYANKGWILDENAIDGLEEDWTSNRIAQYKRVRSGYINMIKPEQGQTVSPELMRMPGETQQIMQSISNTLGNEIAGQREGEVKSGRHFIAKENQQTKSLTKLFKNRANSLRAVTEMSLGFIQHYVTAQQVIRITTDLPGIETEQEITVNQSVFSIEQGQIIEKVVNDLDAVEYDIEVVAEPYSVSSQDDRYNKLGDIFNAAKEVDPRKANAMLPIIVKAMNHPQSEEIIKKWAELDAPNPEQEQLKQIMIQIQMIMAKLGVEEKKVEVEGKELDNVKKAQEIKQLQRENVFNKLLPEKNSNNGKSQLKKSKQIE